jgi:catechol 2,3-dioxygenase-like lactoylglutathione lyase family enzyme
MRGIASRRRISLYGVRYHLRNIAGKIGVEGTQELRGWPGFPATSALAARRNPPMTDQLELGPLGQVSMYIKSAPAAQAWYRDILGLRHLFTFGDLVFFDLGGTRLYMHAVPAEDWKPSSILYFRVPDVHAAVAVLVARGVHISGAPHMIHRDEPSGDEEWMAFFDDPDGNMLAVMARVPAAEAVTAAA